jgi:hypothetical protein
MGADNSFTANGDMPYDLRQIYAVEILGPILKAIEYHREKSEFLSWYDKLTMSLHTNIYQKLIDSERKEYETLNNETMDVLNKNKDAFCGRDKSPEKIHNVKMALKKLEMWLKQKMQEHGLFGSGFSDDDGL